MKKITTVFVAVLVLITAAVCVSAKSYSYPDNSLIIILTDEAAQKVREGELKINKKYFSDSDLGVTKVECINHYEGQAKDTYVLKLNKHSHENVLRVIKILKTYDDIEDAMTNAYARTEGINKFDVELKAGENEKIKSILRDVKKWKSSDEKIAVVKNGKVTALKKGEVKIIAKYEDGGKGTCKVKVTTSSKLVQNGKTVKNLTVKKGSTVKVKIKGKAKKIDNKYKSTKIAGITSKKSASNITVQGIKKGNTTLKIKVNGVKTLKLKVKVK